MKTDEEYEKMNTEFFEINMKHFEKNNYTGREALSALGTLFVTSAVMLGMDRTTFKNYLVILEDAFASKYSGNE